MYKKRLFENSSKEPFNISRSKIDMFLECPRCFYLDRKLGVSRPSMPGFSLNNAVDELLKKEFNIHRAKNQTHPLMSAYGIDAVPFDDPRMDEWRDALRRGITYLHKPTNLLITGGIDDVWIKPDGELIIVDYKATSTIKEISLDDQYKQGYKLQMEVYQWLFRQNGFKVSSTGYFVFCNGKTDRAAFDGKLEFDISIIPYVGKDAWVEKVLFDIHKCLMSEKLPASRSTCDYCQYRNGAKQFEVNN